MTWETHIIFQHVENGNELKHEVIHDNIEELDNDRHITQGTKINSGNDNMGRVCNFILTYRK